MFAYSLLILLSLTFPNCDDDNGLADEPESFDRLCLFKHKYR